MTKTLEQIQQENRTLITNTIIKKINQFLINQSEINKYYERAFYANTGNRF